MRMSKTERRCPPYEGGDPYLYFCFTEKDREAVFPLLEHMYRRGVRIWYSTETTADIGKLNHQQDRMNKASLLVIYLTENARHDERVKNALLYYQHGKPVIGIDTDDGDNELAFGLTAAAKHLDGRIGRNREEMEAELIRTEGFTQELIGEPPKGRNWMKKATVLILAAALLTAGAAWYGYRYLGWFAVELPQPSPGTEEATPIPSPTPTLVPTPEPTPSPTPEPTAIPDTVFFDDSAFTNAVRKAVPGGVITEESLAEVTVLQLDRLPADLSLLSQVLNLEKLKVPQSEAVKALTQTEGRYVIILAPEEVTAQ